MSNLTSPISSNLDQVYQNEQAGNPAHSIQSAESVSDIIKKADGSIALEIVQSLFPTAFPAVVSGVVSSDASSQGGSTRASVFDPPPEVGNTSEAVPGGTVNAVA